MNSLMYGFKTFESSWGQPIFFNLGNDLLRAKVVVIVNTENHWTSHPMNLNAEIYKQIHVSISNKQHVCTYMFNSYLIKRTMFSERMTFL
jgi:hypothetical protein